LEDPLLVDPTNLTFPVVVISPPPRTGTPKLDIPLGKFVSGISFLLHQEHTGFFTYLPRGIKPQLTLRIGAGVSPGP
jgi:hypothetical protein